MSSEEGSNTYSTILFGKSATGRPKAPSPHPQKGLLLVLSKRSCVSNFPKQNQVSDFVLSLHAKFYVPKCSLIFLDCYTLVPTIGILSTTVQHHEFTLVDLCLSADQNPFTLLCAKIYHHTHCCQTS